MLQARLRRRRTAVAAAASAIVVVGLLRITPAYAAECAVRIAGIGSGSIGSRFHETPDRRTELHVSLEEIDQLLRSPKLGRAVAGRLGVLHRDVAGRVDITHDPVAGVYRFKAVDARPGFAKDLCNATMEQSLSLRVALAKQRVSQITSLEQSKVTKYHEALQQTNEQIRQAKDVPEQLAFRLKVQHILADIADLKANIRDLQQTLTVGIADGGQIVHRAEQASPFRSGLWETVALSASPGLVVPLKITGS